MAVTLGGAGVVVPEFGIDAICCRSRDGDGDADAKADTGLGVGPWSDISPCMDCGGDIKLPVNQTR
jgi:hypothetical protein